MRFPFARAFRMPALTRSTINERSSSATAPKTMKTILPAGVDVSTCSEKETKSTPNALNVSKARSKCPYEELWKKGTNPSTPRLV
jgi:hypothetical protein